MRFIPFPLDTTYGGLCFGIFFHFFAGGWKKDGEPASIDPHGTHGDGQAGGRLRRVRVGVQGLGKSLANKVQCLHGTRHTSYTHSSAVVRAERDSFFATHTRMGWGVKISPSSSMFIFLLFRIPGDFDEIVTNMPAVSSTD